MKRFYALAVLAAALTGFGAQEVSAAKMQLSAPASRAELTMADVCRYYLWDRHDMMVDMKRTETEVSIVLADEATGKVLIRGMKPSQEVPAFVDLAARTLTFLPDQSIGVDGNYGGTQYTFPLYFEDYKWDSETFTATYTCPPIDKMVGTIAEDGTITFQENDILFIHENNVFDRWNCSLAAREMKFTPTEAPEIDPTTVWEDLEGMGKFVDGWVFPGLATSGAGTIAAPERDVRIQRNQGYPNLYRVVDPFDHSIYRDDNMARSAKGNIVFDLTDPDFVMFTPGIYSGFEIYDGIDEEYGKTVYCYDVAGLYKYLNPEFTQAEIREAAAKDGFGADAFATFHDGIVDVPQCVFGLVGDIGIGRWQDEKTKEFLPMVGKIVFPGYSGIESVSAEAQAPAEYFNLQGQRVAQPAKGQLLIKRQGATATKVVF